MSDCGLVHYLYMLGAFAVGLGAGHYWGHWRSYETKWHGRKLRGMLKEDIQKVAQILGPYSESEKGSPQAKAIAALHTMVWRLYEWPKKPYESLEKGP